MICKNTIDISRVAHAKGRNYAEIDGIRIIFEDGVLQGWYDPRPENNVPSEDVTI